MKYLSIVSLAILSLLNCSDGFAEAPREALVAARYFPADALVYGEIGNLSQVIDTVLDHPIRAQIEAIPEFQQAKQSPQFKQAMLGVEMFENLVQMPWREAIEAFSQDGVAFAIDHTGKGLAIIVDGKDRETMAMLRDRVIGLVQLDGNRNVQSVEYRGIKATRVDDVRFAVHEDRLLVTNSSDLGKAILDRMLDGGENNLATSPRFSEAHAGRSNATFWGYVDVTAVRDSDMADEFYNSQINNPVGELLAGAFQSTLQNTPYATASVRLETHLLSAGLSMPFNADWIPEEREYYFGASGKGRAPLIADSDETLFTLATHRDFGQMWMRAPDLYNAKINDEFAKADAGLGVFFAGKQFGEDILGAIEPEVAFVATRQDFTTRSPKPAIKLPAFGLVMRMKDAENTTDEMRRTFQNMIGFFSVIGAMEGFGQLDHELEKTDDGSIFVASHFLVEERHRDSTNAPIVHNFSPTAGFRGDRFVVASSTELAKKLTNANPLEIRHDVENTKSQLDAKQLAAVLSDNREQLISQNMLEDGNSREEAETQINLLLRAIEFFHDANFQIQQENGLLKSDFSIRIAADKAANHD